MTASTEQCSTAEDRLGPACVDDLGAMLLALLSEHWILRDRFAVLESLMLARGALRPGELDDHVPTQEAAAELERLRDRIVGSVIGAPLAARDSSVDAILRRAGMTRPRPEQGV